jgi:hypothetical protein
MAPMNRVEQIQTLCASLVCRRIMGPTLRLIVCDAMSRDAVTVGRVIPGCHFRKTATEYDSKPGVKRSSCTEK